MTVKLLALAWFLVAVPLTAQAADGWVEYKPGALKAALARGETVLLDYKATW